MKTEKDANWYVLRVKIGCEKKIGLNLHNLGFEVLYPLKRELRDWSDRKKWVEVAIFVGYIFVKISKTEKNKVFIDKNIFAYLKISKELCKLRSEEVSLIKSLSNLPNFERVSYTNLEKGVLVEVQTGFLCGYCGEIIEILGKKRLHIKIVNMNCEAVFVLEVVELKVLDI